MKQDIADALNYFSCGYFFKEAPFASGESIIEELSLHSESKALIEEAEKVIQELGLPMLDVRLGQTKSGFEGEQENNIIRIKPDLPASIQRSVAVMELANIIYHKKSIEIWKIAHQGGYKSEEDYARTKEYKEFLALKRRTATTRSINERHGRFFRSYMENN